MKRQSVTRWTVAAAAATMLAACSGQPEGGGEPGSVSLSLQINGFQVDRVVYEITGGPLTSPVVGQLAIDNDQVSTPIRNLPVGTGYVITLAALDSTGAVFCTGTSLPFDITDGAMTQVDMVLTCGQNPDDLRGDVAINASFETFDFNVCPVLNSVSAIPSTIPEGGDSSINVVFSDRETAVLIYSWSAAFGSFDDPTVSDPTYTCSVAGPQTLTVLVSDGDPACDQTLDILVGCGGEELCTPDPCTDTGNECTQSLCDPLDGSCPVSNLADGSPCSNDGVCVAGACVPNQCLQLNCDDGNECTVDSCDRDLGCVNTGLDDASACDGGLGICTQGTCASVCDAGIVDCDDANPCTVDICVAATGQCAPPQQEPDGTSCGANGQTCQGGVCVGAVPAAQVVNAGVSCILPLGLGNADVSVDLTITPAAAWTPNGAADIGLQAVAVIPASLGQILIDLGTDLINIDSLTADLAVAGGTPNPITVVKGAESIDIDADNDLVAEAVTIVIPVPDETVTNDGSPSVDFSVGGFTVSLSGVPLLGNLVVSSDPAVSSVECTLTTNTASFAVN